MRRDDFILRRLETATGMRHSSASDRHFSDSIEVDISSMRQLVTEAPESGIRMIDSLHEIMQSERKATDHKSKNRAYYWQHLEIRQAQRVAMFKRSTKQGRLLQNWDALPHISAMPLHMMLQQ